MAGRPRVLLTTEGTYPYHPGGVSTWCNTLVHRLSEVDFVVFGVAMNPYVEIRFPLPPNVVDVVTVPLWGMQDPSEYRRDLRYAEIFLKKQRTTPKVVEELFLPLFSSFLALLAEGEPGRLGEVLAAMYRYFQGYDYLLSFKAPVVWETFRAWTLAESERGRWQEPTVYEAVQGLGWVYHFLLLVNSNLPDVDLVHSSAAAFCGIPGIVSKLERGTPYLLTEHGVYLREQYLAVGRSNMSPFAKRFLLALVRSVVRENLYYADRIAPVCAFNARWERRLGARADKIGVIYNGVDPERFFPRAEPPAEDQPVTLLSVARVDPNKDLETLLQAVSIVHRRGVPVRTVVQGAISVQEYYDAVLRLRSELGLDEVVDFSGHTEDIAAVYRQADVVVQSSLTEAFPYSVIEAMMSGVPLVATDVGGTREAIADTGVLIPARDPVRLAVGLLLLAEDRERRRHLGRLARERALAQFSIERMLARLRSAYGLLMGQRLPKAEEAVLSLTKAHLLAALGQVEEALEQLRLALEQGPRHIAPVVLWHMAQLEWRRGHVAQAVDHLVRARILADLERQEPRSA